MPRLKFCNKITLVGFAVALSLYAISQNMKLIYSSDSKMSLQRLEGYDIGQVQGDNRGPYSKPLYSKPQPLLDMTTTLKIKKIYKHINMSQDVKSFPPTTIGKYLLLNPSMCSDTSLVDLIIIVHTAPNNLEKRQNIRKTFAKRSYFVPFQVRVAFLMGRSRDDAINVKLASEHEKNGDTVMGDFIDDYHNLTLKGVMGFRWISQYCPNSKFVLKIDDDVVVDTFKLLTTYIPHMSGKTKSFFCNVWRKNMKIERSGKWGLPAPIFENLKVFPYYYCSGFTLLMTGDLIGPLYRAAQSTPFFWIDDLYLFGMLPFVVGDITYYDYQIGKNISLRQDESMDCLNKLGLQCNYFSTLLRKDTYDVEYMKMWNKIQSLYDRRTWRPLTFFEP